MMTLSCGRTARFREYSAALLTVKLVHPVECPQTPPNPCAWALLGAPQRPGRVPPHWRPRPRRSIRHSGPRGNGTCSTVPSVAGTQRPSVRRSQDGPGVGLPILVGGIHLSLVSYGRRGCRGRRGGRRVRGRRRYLRSSGETPPAQLPRDCSAEWGGIRQPDESRRAPGRAGWCECLRSSRRHAGTATRPVPAL